MSGVSVETLLRGRAQSYLGVCLVHQALAIAFGGRVERIGAMHGKTSVAHEGTHLFAGLTGPVGGPYHPLVIPPITFQKASCAWRGCRTTEPSWEFGTSDPLATCSFIPNCADAFGPAILLTLES
jgi:anthranilate/para-aminobenzoate synthase component II